MLFFTKLENEVDKKEKVQVDEVLLNVVSKLSSKAKHKNIKLNIKTIDMCELNTNPILLQTIFVNIIDNAIKYTLNDKNIYIYLECKDKLIFRVVDEGIGIKKEDIDKLTQRFYRTELSRNRNIQGFGLGLSIVSKALEVIGGEIRFESKENQGTIVEVFINV